YLGNRDELESITAEVLRQQLTDDEVVLLDIRPRAEYEAGHLPGAISLPPDQLDRLDGVLAGLPHDHDVVAYCRGPYCVYADDAIRQLNSGGRRAVRLVEGIPEWRQQGGPIET
ncbi:MAG TPA: rhodanese-like domain-containing protein, partial [Acidimicrobiia bacterium]|nr:rhodanese-like domain-containing protein [Acidimicrobiia bacterium]